jgi:putative spermidine/putrescine transport system substrate-binding protein
MRKISLRRRFTGIVSTLFLAAIISMQGGVIAAQTSGSVVFAGWGGSIQQAQRTIIFDAFERETGIKVIDVPDVSLTKIKVMVNSGDVQWDVAQALGMWVPLGASDNLWEKLDYTTINGASVPNEFRKVYGIGNSAYGQVLAYNRKELGNAPAPTSWADFWDIKGRPGARGLVDAPRYTLEYALLADGVPPNALYPLDVDRAFKSLDRIKSSVAVWYKQWPQVPILLASGELIMANTSHTRILDLVKTEGVPVELVWNQALITVDYLTVPRGAKNAENAMKLIAYMTRADVQAALARETGIGPTSQDALGLLSDQERVRLPSYHYQKGEMVLFNDEWWAKNTDKMIERWDEWKLQ